ncbi:hypothetical protein Tco_1479261 [Tanacetum coccineum]
MNSPPNHEWEQALDINDFDLQLTPALCPSNNPNILYETTTAQTLSLSQNHQVNNCVEKPIRIIPGPVGIVQMAKLCKIADTQEGEEESVMSIQEYIRKIIEDVGEDHDFTRGSWLSVVEYVNVDGGIVIGVLEMSRNFLRMGNLRKLLQFLRIGNSECVGRSHSNTQRPFWCNLWYYSLQSAYGGKVCKGNYRRSIFDTS